MDAESLTLLSVCSFIKYQKYWNLLYCFYPSKCQQTRSTASRSEDPFILPRNLGMLQLVTKQGESFNRRAPFLQHPSLNRQTEPGLEGDLEQRDKGSRPQLPAAQLLPHSAPRPCQPVLGPEDRSLRGGFRPSRGPTCRDGLRLAAFSSSEGQLFKQQQKQPGCGPLPMSSRLQF